jgi:gliding motility-associated-like protein
LRERSFAVLQAAAFFTPNGDGANDYWNLKGLNGSIYKNAKIFIFDRYGKLLKQLNPYGVGWDIITEIHFLGRLLVYNTT